MYFDLVINMCKNCIKYRGISFYYVGYQLNQKKTYTRSKFKPERKQFRIRYQLPEEVDKMFLDSFHLMVHKSIWKREVYDFECGFDLKDQMVIVLDIDEDDSSLTIKTGPKGSSSRKIFPEAAETEVRVGCCFL